MDKMSWISIICVSIPESFLIILSIMAIIRADYKILSNIHKIILASVASSCLMAIGRSYNTNLIINVLMMYVITIALYSLITKVEWQKISIALLLSMLGFGIIELAIVGVSMTFLDISIESVQGNDLMRFAFSVPVRLCEIGFIVLLNRLEKPIIELRIISFSVNLMKKVISVYVFLILCLIKMLSTIKYFVFDISAFERQQHFGLMMQDILFVLCTISMSFYISSKIINNLDNKVSDKKNTLLLVRSLLEKDKNDKIKKQAIDIIDDSIK